MIIINGVILVVEGDGAIGSRLMGEVDCAEARNAYPCSGVTRVPHDVFAISGDVNGVDIRMAMPSFVYRIPKRSHE